MLKVTKLEVRYGAAQAVHGISLDVAKGEIVCLVGSNGAGKSSSLKGIMGLQTARGAVSVAGTDVGELPSHQRVARGLALVPEGRHVFPQMSVRENLLSGCRRKEPALAKQRIEEITAMFPVLSERIEQAAGTMSGGEQQMVAIGRALMSNPTVLLLDEPTLGLAPVVIDRLMQALKDLRARGLAILLAEQNLHMALNVADRGYVLETGRMVLQDDAAGLRRDPRVIEAYLGE